MERNGKHVANKKIGTGRNREPSRQAVFVIFKSIFIPNFPQLTPLTASSIQPLRLVF